VVYVCACACVRARARVCGSRNSAENKGNLKLCYEILDDYEMCGAIYSQNRPTGSVARNGGLKFKLGEIGEGVPQGSSSVCSKAYQNRIM
jgi:hypothetical protein